MVTQGWRGQIEVMSRGLSDTRMEVPHPCGVTWTHGDMRMERMDNSDVTWTDCDTSDGGDT